MSYIEEMIFDRQFEEAEKLILDGIFSLDDLSEEAFEIFRKWAEGE